MASSPRGQVEIVMSCESGGPGSTCCVKLFLAFFSFLHFFYLRVFLYQTNEIL